MQIKIQYAEMEDAEKLAELFVRYNKELEQYEMAYSLLEESVLAAMQSRIRSKIACAAVAKHENEIVGFIFCNISRLSGYSYEGSPLFGYIADTYVLPEFRKQGIAKRLAEHAIGWLKENEVSYVELKVLESNSAAHRFWCTNGFAPTTRTYGKQI